MVETDIVSNSKKYKEYPIIVEITNILFEYFNLKSMDIAEIRDIIIIKE
jgi:hypothetical protein